MPAITRHDISDFTFIISPHTLRVQGASAGHENQNGLSLDDLVPRESLRTASFTSLAPESSRHSCYGLQLSKTSALQA